jgi:hypothetical protein
MEWVAPAIICAIALLFLVAGLLTVIGPGDRSLGVRLPEAVKDDPAWHAASRSAATWFITGGVSTLLVTVSSIVVDHDEEGLLRATIVGCLVLLCYLAIATFVGIRAARRCELREQRESL